VLTPLALVGVGYLVTRATKRLESVQWANRTVIQRRLEIFSEVAPKLNRLLCFALFIGRWKETKPSDAINLKRETDEVIHVNRVLFSPRLCDTYNRYMEALFHAYARPDSDALIRVQIATALGDRRKLPWWETSMESCFASFEIPPEAEILAAYKALEEAFRHDLYV
jgi:hypothetical protein